MSKKKLVKEEIVEKLANMISKPEPPSDADVAKILEISKDAKEEYSRPEWLRLLWKVYWEALKKARKFRK